MLAPALPLSASDPREAICAQVTGSRARSLARHDCLLTICGSRDRRLKKVFIVRAVESWRASSSRASSRRVGTCLRVEGLRSVGREEEGDGPSSDGDGSDDENSVRAWPSGPLLGVRARRCAETTPANCRITTHYNANISKIDCRPYEIYNS